MASFFVETYVPPDDRDRFSTDVTGLRTAVEAIDESERTVQHVRSYLVPSDAMGVHVLEAETVEAVMRLVKSAGIDVERIVPAIGDPAEGPGSRQPLVGRPGDDEARKGGTDEQVHDA